MEVLPTYVGVILMKNVLKYPGSSTTHIRGGDPYFKQLRENPDEYYPHTWG